MKVFFSHQLGLKMEQIPSFIYSLSSLTQVLRGEGEKGKYKVKNDFALARNASKFHFSKILIK